MGIKGLDPLKTVSFHCRECAHRFKAEPDEALSAPDLEHHPFEYRRKCPKCFEVAEQAAWEKNILKAHANATGPKTPEGKAASAKNLEGHPTPEEAMLTRFNAMKTGLHARVANYFPAKPGKYARCEGCEYLADLACMQETPRACLKRHDLILRHQIAFQSGDPNMLMELRSDTQAAIQSLIDEMILAIAQDGGPRTITPVWYHDKDGGFHLAKFVDPETKEEIQINEIKEHPLLKRLMDYINKNSMTLGDMGMTPKVQEQNENLRGYLDNEATNAEAEEEYRQKTLEGQRRLEQLISNSLTPADAVVIDGEVEVIDA